jgi:predicted N-acetyltransferase YhbS
MKSLENLNVDFLIRRAAPDDAPVILALILAAFEPYRGKLQPESSALRETADSVRQALAANEGLAAWTGGRVVGSVIVEAREGRGVYLGRLAVDPAHRGRGIAASLVGAAEAWARSTGRFQVELNVRIALPDNIRLFERLGYRETARKAHPGFAQPTYLVMEKSLL